MTAPNLEKTVQLAKAALTADTRDTACQAFLVFDQRRRTLTPETMLGFERRMRRVFNEVTHPRVSFGRRPQGVSWLSQLFAPQNYMAKRVLMALSPDGRTREAAVKNLVVDPADTAAVAVLMLRCNDWVPQVQLAARDALQAVLPKMSAENLMPFVMFTELSASNWWRGGARAAQMLKYHENWGEATNLVVTTAMVGPLARMTRQMLKTPSYDDQLETFAVAAKSAFVRRVAVAAILENVVRWHVGREWKWSDRSLGYGRWEKVFDKRDLLVTADVQHRILGHAARDKSAAIRVLACDFLISHGGDEYSDMVAKLKLDKSATVRDRMGFYERKWGNDAPKEDAL